MGDPGQFGLYIHWPYCQAKCPYCDFNSHVVDKIDHLRWRSSYLSEIKRLYSDIGPRTLTSVFFGGGTPSLMEPSVVGDILTMMRETWPVANDLEVTLEANPTSVEAARFRDFHAAGVNRVSVGVQALNNDDLRRLGRLHSADEARHAVATAQAIFDRVSFDLIYARQHQSVDAWHAELLDALSFGVDHLSLYQLTIEPNTAFGDRHARGRLPGLVEEGFAADMYDLTQQLCAAAGLPAYEVSNHARDMAQSRHNLIYWRGGDYAGIGPGAHGRLTLNGTRVATETHLAPLTWLLGVERAGTGETTRERLTPLDHAIEYVMMSMRLTGGCDLDRLQMILGRRFRPEILTELEDMGMVACTSRSVRATLDGRRVLNAVISKLIDDLDG